MCFQTVDSGLELLKRYGTHIGGLPLRTVILQGKGGIAFCGKKLGVFLRQFQSL